MPQLKLLARIGVLIFLSLVVYSCFEGLRHPVPALGDSWDYHIPISRMILDGSFLHPGHRPLPQQYYPGSAEGINAVFLFLHIPLTISNLFASIVLFFCLWRLGRVFTLEYYTALFYAVSFSTLTVITRWFNAVSIDVWVAVFFVLAIILFEKLQNKWQDYLKLGIVLGMLLGSKSAAVIYVLLLLGIYAKRFLSQMNLSRQLVFLIPFTTLGIFWYVRNYFLLGNPFYPLDFLGLPNAHLFSDSIWQQVLSHPIGMMNAFFSEYKLWMVAPLLCLVGLVVSIRLKGEFSREYIFVSSLGLITFVYLLFFPTSSQNWIMVSSLRYSYPTFILLLLGVFLLAKKYQKEELLGYLAISCMFSQLTMAYYPKLILLAIPLSLVSFYLIQKYEPREVKQVLPKKKKNKLLSL